MGLDSGRVFAGRTVQARPAGGSLDPGAGGVNPLAGRVVARLKVVDAADRIMGHRRRADDAIAQDSPCIAVR